MTVGPNARGRREPAHIADAIVINRKAVKSPGLRPPTQGRQQGDRVNMATSEFGTFLI